MIAKQEPIFHMQTKNAAPDLFSSSDLAWSFSLDYSARGDCFHTPFVGIKSEQIPYLEL
jgi:hypothetical protein